jgi:hypothetical protein
MNHDGTTNREISEAQRGKAVPIRPARGQGSQSGQGYPAGSDRGAETAGKDHRSDQTKPRFGQDPAGRLTRQILNLLQEADLCLVLSDSTSWASATFTGARHLILLERGASGTFNASELRLIDALPEYEFTLSRHLVADLTALVMENEDRPLLRIEALTVDV